MSGLAVANEILDAILSVFALSVCVWAAAVLWSDSYTPRWLRRLIPLLFLGCVAMALVIAWKVLR